MTGPPSVPAVTVVLGDEDLLAERAVDDAVAAALNALGEGTTVEEVSGGSLPDGFALGLGTLSLFGGGRVVVVSDAQELDAAGRQAVLAAAADPAPGVVVILRAPATGRLGKFFQQLGAAGDLRTVQRLKPAERGRWVRKELARHDRRADDAAVEALLDTVGTDLRELAGAIAKLVVAVPPPASIAAEHIANFLARTAERGVFEFTDAVLGGRVGIALGHLDSLLAQGDEPLALLGMLAHQLRLLLRVSDQDRLPASRAAQALGGGVRDWQVERARRQLRRFGPGELRQALAHVADTDADVRANELPPRVLLELLVARIATLRGAPAGARSTRAAAATGC